MAFLYMAGTRALERQVWETIDAEIKGLREQYSQSGLPGLIRTIDERSEAARERRSVYLLVDRTGRKLAGNLELWPVRAENETDGFRFTLPDSPEMSSPQSPVFGADRPVLARAFLLQGNARLLVGRDIQDQIASQLVLRNAILLGILIMIVLGVVAGYVVSRWMLSRLERVNRTTRQIMAGDLGRRIDTNGVGDEFDELAGNVNDMLERIESLLTGMRQVTDNIAHDLRTPLHRLRSRIEVALMQNTNVMESRQLLDETIREVDGLIETFNALLRIARLEAGDRHSDWEPLDLGELARDVVELYEPLAEDRSITLRYQGNAQARTNGNRQLLAQAVANLTDNAIKYTQERGEIIISVDIRPEPTITVLDNGPGIPRELRDKALERFVRLAPERSGPGNGLGLSLVQAVARLHDARLELHDNNPGLAVTIRFSNDRHQTTSSINKAAARAA